MRTHALAVLGAALALAGGCGSGGPDAPLPTEVTSALETALTRDDPERCADIFTPDAEIVPEDQPPVAGTAAIVAFCRDLAAPELSFDTTRLITLRRGDLAVEQGTYRVRNVREGADVEHGHYMAAWKRIDGQWRIFRSLYNTTETRRAQTTVTPDGPSPE